MPRNVEESSGAASIDCNENLEFKRLSLLEEKDHISDLPDSIIHHILSFLPSIKEAIQTSVISKRWKNQWTRVPVLAFNEFKTFSIIESVLFQYQCSKIKKFECFLLNCEEHHLRFVIHFATKRNVEELILYNYQRFRVLLPQFLFNNISLVSLILDNNVFEPNERVKWGCLKALLLSKCNLSNQGIENALSGSPSLQKLQLFSCYCDNQVVIASKSLQELIIYGIDSTVTDISCPNLQKLMCRYSTLCGQVIQNISSGFPSLESLDLSHCDVVGLKQLAIASKSLKRLVLGYNDDDDIENSRGFKLSDIVCPNLEELDLFGRPDFLPCAVMNFPSAVYATLSFQNSGSVLESILQQLQHVKELTIGSSFLKHNGIAWALQNFHVLEKLTVKLPQYDCEYTHPDFNDCGEIYLHSYSTFLKCLVSHLSIVKIIGFPKDDKPCNFACNFIEFLLKNGVVLEKLVVISRYCETEFGSEVHRKLLSFKKCNKHVIIEFLWDMD